MIRLVVEPWGDEKMVPVNGTVIIEYKGPSGGRIEIALKPGEIILYAWEGSIIPTPGQNLERHIFDSDLYVIVVSFPSASLTRHTPNTPIPPPRGSLPALA